MALKKKKKILFVGAGGMVASAILPRLSKTYEIVGIAGKRDDLRAYCSEFYTGDLVRDHTSLFEKVFTQHVFHSIIWNPGRFFHSKLLDSSREHLLTEFDLGVALPLECLKRGKESLAPGATFVVISSTDAFNMPPGRGSYSIIKRSQVDMVGYLARELSGEDIFSKAIALGRVGEIPTDLLEKAFIRAIENAESLTKALYIVQGSTIQ